MYFIVLLLNKDKTLLKFCHLLIINLRNSLLVELRFILLKNVQSLLKVEDFFYLFQAGLIAEGVTVLDFLLFIPILIIFIVIIFSIGSTGS